MFSTSTVWTGSPSSYVWPNVVLYVDACLVKLSYIKYRQTNSPSYQLEEEYIPGKYAPYNIAGCVICVIFHSMSEKVPIHSYNQHSLHYYNIRSMILSVPCTYGGHQFSYLAQLYPGVFRHSSTASRITGHRCMSQNRQMASSRDEDTTMNSSKSEQTWRIVINDSFQHF